MSKLITNGKTQFQPRLNLIPIGDFPLSLPLSIDSILLYIYCSQLSRGVLQATLNPTLSAHPIIYNGKYEILIVVSARGYIYYINNAPSVLCYAIAPARSDIIFDVCGSYIFRQSNIILLILRRCCFLPYIYKAKRGRGRVREQWTDSLTDGRSVVNWRPQKKEGKNALEAPGNGNNINYAIQLNAIDRRASAATGWGPSVMAYI